jgi:hypothetical protein
MGPTYTGGWLAARVTVSRPSLISATRCARAATALVSDQHRPPVVLGLLERRERQQTLMTIEHALLPPGLVGQHERGWAAIARQLGDELTAPATPPRP